MDRWIRGPMVGPITGKLKTTGVQNGGCYDISGEQGFVSKTRLEVNDL